MAIAIRSFEQVVGDGVTTVFPIQHRLLASDIFIQARELSTGQVYSPMPGGDMEVVIDDYENLTVTFLVAPAAGDMRIYMYKIRGD